MKFFQDEIVVAGDMSTNLNSIGIDCDQVALASIQASWTGALANGTLQLQISDDIVPVQASSMNPVGPNPAGLVTNWSNYTGSATTVSGPGNFTWNLVYVGYRWIRLVYTMNSGAGTLTANISGKG